MNERPLAPPASKQETPIPDPIVFLLNRGNWQFIHGQRATPLLKKPITMPSTMSTLLVVGVILVVTIPAIVLLQIIVQFGSLAGFIIGFLLLAVVGVGGARYRKQKHPQQEGALVKGTVVRAEKVRIWDGGTQKETIRVRYRFADPGGVICYGEEEGDSSITSDSMAPAFGTAVYIWLMPNGEHYQL